MAGEVIERHNNDGLLAISVFLGNHIHGEFSQQFNIIGHAHRVFRGRE